MFKKYLSFVLICSIMLISYAGVVNAALINTENAPFSEEQAEEEALSTPSILWGYPLSGTITSTVSNPSANISLSLNDGANLASVVLNNNYLMGSGKGGYIGAITWVLTFSASGLNLDAY